MLGPDVTAIPGIAVEIFQSRPKYWTDWHHRAVGCDATIATRHEFDFHLVLAKGCTVWTWIYVTFYFVLLFTPFQSYPKRSTPVHLFDFLSCSKLNACLWSRRLVLSYHNDLFNQPFYQYMFPSIIYGLATGSNISPLHVIRLESPWQLTSAWLREVSFEIDFVWKPLAHHQTQQHERL